MKGVRGVLIELEDEEECVVEEEDRAGVWK